MGEKANRVGAAWEWPCRQGCRGSPEELGVPPCQGWDLSQHPLCLPPEAGRHISTSDFSHWLLFALLTRDWPKAFFEERDGERDIES